MSLLAHHAEAYIHVEIGGKPFPDGMTEHALALGLAGVLLALAVYGLYAGTRDLRARLRRPAPMPAPVTA